MSRADMRKLASSKSPFHFSADSQSYDQILGLLKNYHTSYRQPGRSQHHDLSVSSKDMKQLEKACAQYLEKPGANPKRTKAVDKLYTQIQALNKDAGRAYFTARDNGRIDKSNLNCQANFAGTQDKIECRHIALQEILDRQKEDLAPIKGHRADQRAGQRGTLAQMAERMNPQLDDLYKKIYKFSARDNYVVDHSKWGEFFHAIFSRMPIPSTRYMLMASGNHAMAVRLRAKQGPQGRAQYVINFHDPNRTLSDKRLSADSLEQVKGLRIGDFLDTEFFYESYFGGPGNENREQVSMFQEVPIDFHTRPLTEPIDCAASESRSVSMFFSEQRTFHPGLAYHLFATGLPLSELRAQLGNCPREQVFSLLAAKSSGGVPGYNLALAFGLAATIKDYGQLVIEATQKGLIDKQQVFELLAAKDPDGLPHSLSQKQTCSLFLNLRTHKL